MAKRTVKPKLVARKVPAKDGKYTIVHTDYNSLSINFKKVEDAYKAKYVGEFTLKTKDGSWGNKPVSVFYTKEAHPKGSNYFGLFITNDYKLMITNAAIVADKVWSGVLNSKTNEILYSAYRHDFQEYGGMMADGGADYNRTSAHPYAEFKIVDGEFIVTRTEEEYDYCGY